MKKILFSILALALVFQASARPLRQSEIRTDTIKSVILGEDVKVNVYLPAGFDPEGTRLYPVVYLLHGLTDTYTAWQERGRMKDVADELIRSGEAARMVIIMPNAGDPDARNVWNGYFNQEGHRYEDFFFGELVPQMEKKYLAYGDKQHRAIMGLSMGGGGSVVYCQHHPDMFSSCYAMSAWLDNGEPCSDDPEDKLYKVCKSVHENSAIDFVNNADDATLAKLRTIKWFIDCGDDDFIFELSALLYISMYKKEVPAEFRVRDGIHNWEYWHTSLRQALPFATRNFGEPEEF